MAQRFKIGELVKLKSGGPLMTVVSFNSGFIFARWYDKEGNLWRGCFETDAVRKPFFKGFI